MKVIKRNGKLVDFNKDKIRNALIKAFDSCGYKIENNVINNITNSVQISDKVNIENIQDQLINILRECNYNCVADNFLKYRWHKANLRKNVQKKIDYIEQYKKSDNTANVTIDANANVGNHNIAVLNAEIHKPENQEINMRILRNTIEKLFPDFDYKQMDKDFNTIAYLHDANSQIGMPYTYSSQEVIEVLYNNKHLLLSFEMLWDVVDEESVLINEIDQVYQKKPSNLFVKDKGDTYVEVNYITKKKRHRDLVKVAITYGNDIIVTDNHPMITHYDDLDNTIQAKDSLGRLQFIDNPKVKIGNNYIINFDSKEIKANHQLGFIVGWFIGNGEYDGDKLVFKSQEKGIIDSISHYFETLFGNISKEINDNSIIINDEYVTKLFKEYFKINNTIPYNVLEFNEEFISSILTGLKYSCGEINDDFDILHLKSRTCALQLIKLFELQDEHVTMFNSNTIRVERLPLSKTIEGYYKIIGVSNMDYHTPIIEANEYIYDITTESSTFICNDILVHNCVAISLYPFLLNGIKELGGLSAAPKNIESFCGMFINLLFAISAQYKGAVATPGALLIMNYFLEKRYGEDYIYHLYDSALGENVHEKRSIVDQINQFLQQIVYSINQPSSARGAQSLFCNFSFFDKAFFEGMYGDFYFPDGTRPHWETFNWLQQHFLHWLNMERLKCILTFPVCSYALIYKDEEFQDKQAYEFVCQEYAEGNSFFTYISDSADSLSSCCFSGETIILYKAQDGIVKMGRLYNLFKHERNLEVCYNGKWVKGKIIQLPGRPMYEVSICNNDIYTMTDNHINITLRGEVKTIDLTEDDYLLYNNTPLEATSDKNLTYNQGIFLGLYMLKKISNANAVFKKKIGYPNDICLIIDNNTYDKYQKSLNAPELGIVKIGTGTDDIIFTDKKECFDLLRKYRFNINCIQESIEFRKGIIDTFFDNNRGVKTFSTKNPWTAKYIHILLNSLGIPNMYNKNSLFEEDETFTISLNNFKDYIEKNGKTYWKVNFIRKKGTSQKTYCVECEDESNPYFELPSGLVTHNCRLSNKLQDNTFSFTNGQIGEQTGSLNVITLNLSRIIQDFFISIGNEKGKKATYIPDNWKEQFADYLRNILDRIYKYQLAYKDILINLKEAKMLPAYDAGFINMNRQYLTIGVNALNQAAEYVGIECKNTDEYANFCHLIFGTIKEENTKHRTKDTRFNTEQTPCENAAIKLYNRDKKDGYWIPEDTNLYASYIFKPNDPDLTIFDKLIMHGDKFLGNSCDGGQACHINLSEHLSYEQYKRVVNFAAKVGCKYFTFNVPNSECDDCGYITKVPITECPKCHRKNISYYDRIIG